jgi:hypothetical protein
VRLRHHPRRAAGGEVAVGEPGPAEARGEVRRAAAVDVVAVVRLRCARREVGRGEGASACGQRC